VDIRRSPGRPDDEEFATLLAAARRGREGAASKTEALRCRLPLPYLSQQAHLTAPASDYRLAEKALSGPYQVARRLLDRYEIGALDIAGRLEVPPAIVEETLRGQSAPVVLVDLEDGVPPQKVAEARANAVRLAREVERGSSLYFLRTAAIDDPRCADDLLGVLLEAGKGIPAPRYPIDGIVLAKVRHPHEVEWLWSILAEVESALELEAGQIRVSYQIETGWGVLNLPALVSMGNDRLAGIILGTVDLSADLLLPETRYRHPVNEWARTQITLAAGAMGVPAIDGMTLDFPVGRSELGPEENRTLVLHRMRSNFDDALYSIDRGMSGRWVGHPLQLVATIVAFRSVFSAETIAGELEKLEFFAESVAADRAAAVGPGSELLDLATDRHSRNLLARAVAWGLVPADRARRLGLIADADGTVTA